MTNIENSMVIGAQDEYDRKFAEDPEAEARICHAEKELAQGNDCHGYSFSDVLLAVFEDDRYERAIQEIQRELPNCELSQLVLEHSHRIAEEIESE